MSENLDGIDQLPESWQKHIKELRSENASWRVKTGELSGRLSEYEKTVVAANAKFDELSAQAAKAADEYERAVADKAAVEYENLRMQAAITAGIPSLASRLKGDSLEELVADAETFAQTVAKPTGPRDYAASVDSGKPAVSTDPVSSAFKAAGLL